MTLFQVAQPLIHHHTAGWGSNGRGEEFDPPGMLGDGSSADKSVPTAVSGKGVWSQISAGDWHTCGVKKSDGSAWCEFSWVFTVVCTHMGAVINISHFRE